MHVYPCYNISLFVHSYTFFEMFSSSRQSGVMGLFYPRPLYFRSIMNSLISYICMFFLAGCWKTGRVPWPCKRSCKKCMSDRISRGRVYPWWLLYGYGQSHGHVCRCVCNINNPRELVFNQKWSNSYLNEIWKREFQIVRLVKVKNNSQKILQVSLLSASCHLTADSWPKGGSLSANWWPMVWRWIKQPYFTAQTGSSNSRTEKMIQSMYMYISLLVSSVSVLDQFLACLILPANCW